MEIERFENKEIDNKMPRGRKRTSRSIKGSLLGLLVTVTVVSIAAMVLSVRSYIYLNKMEKMQNKVIDAVEEYIEAGEYDDARDEAAKNGTHAGLDSIIDYIQMKAEQKREEKRIDRKEDENLQEFGITIGRSVKDFINLDYKNVREELIQRGFNKDRIKVTQFPSTDKKYKNTKDGTVIDLYINANNKFTETDKFLPDSLIDIYVHVKEFNADFDK